VSDGVKFEYLCEFDEGRGRCEKPTTFHATVYRHGQAIQRHFCQLHGDAYKGMKAVCFDPDAAVPPLPVVAHEGPLDQEPYMRIAAEALRGGERITLADVREAKRQVDAARELIVESVRAWVAGNIPLPGQVFKDALRNYDVARLNLRACEEACS
jgi:hypothetical protein